ncbi:N-acetyltransferase [Methylobacillus flagellatus]|uniref:GNAT family N-acetyltransferase n=1 Tax=Methylobacillus flagellatus TaxID=405 RepID=UPI002853A7EF|nr:N-acetyltransferase family protein [Methylobacillus flagellatus]MDR5170819.1 N-acetyltransferase [Methylobacillus flagellatus]
MEFVTCTEEIHASAILSILNEAIANSTALYDYKPRSLENMSEWFKAKQASSFPVIGAISPDGELLGFASYGTFRAWPAYKYSIEHSVYIHRDHRGKGLGRILMERLIAKAMEQQYHVMIGGIDESNGASVMLHRRLGFSHAGTIKQAGFKFGRWLDLAFYQLVLQTPHAPVDG